MDAVQEVQKSRVLLVLERVLMRSARLQPTMWHLSAEDLSHSLADSSFTVIGYMHPLISYIAHRSATSMTSRQVVVVSIVVVL